MSFKRLDPEDFLISSDTVTSTVWSDETVTLTTFFTSSTTSTNDDYYKNVYKTSARSDIQFALAYGDKLGSGSAQFNDLVAGKSPTRTVYGQFRNLIYGDENTEFNFGENQASFANDSFRLSPGVFVSYFPSPNITLQGLAQHSELLDLGVSINQRFTAVGGGAKFQLNHILNLELLYTHFVLGKNSGLGQTFNIGLRALFN